jgi:RNA polymerase sigma factor (TIGR02999 family)
MQNDENHAAFLGKIVAELLIWGVNTNGILSRVRRTIRYTVAMSDVTKILAAIERGEESASDELLPLVYEELRKLAAAMLAKQRPGETLHPTMLVHEAYLRLVDVNQPQHWNSRGHFFGAAAEAMRRILVEKARQKKSQKRAHVVEHGAVDELAEIAPVSSLDLLALDEALTAFEQQWPEKAQLVKLRYFAGLTTKEAAEAMGISVRTAERTWTYAKAWLLQAIEGNG